MIALYVALYLLIGFVVACVTGKLNGGYDEADSEDVFVVSMLVLLWPLFLSFAVVMLVAFCLTCLVNKVIGK